ncbi:MAG: SDR family NAD(P)-dependent oxidoreductase [Bacillota bacterium]
MTSKSLAGKKAVITGGNTRLSRAIAIEFAKLGADIVINYDSNQHDVENIVEEINKMGREVIAVQADLAIEEQVISLIKAAENFTGGQIDILINNTGTMFEKYTIEEMDLALWKKVIDTNITSTFLISKHVIPVMKTQKRGKIINISSFAGLTAMSRGSTAYYTFKAAVQAFTKCLAKELAASGIFVNCIVSEAAISQFNKSIFPGREGTPEETAGAAIFLATDLGDKVTGETVEVNCGLFCINGNP